MYERWFPRALQDGRSLVLVASSRGKIEDERLSGHVAELEPIRELEIRRGDDLVGRYWVRVAHGYRSAPVVTEGEQ